MILPTFKHRRPNKINELDVITSDPVWAYSLFDGWLIGMCLKYVQMDDTVKWIFLNATHICSSRFIVEWQPIEADGPIMPLKNNLVFRHPKHETSWLKTIYITEPLLIFGIKQGLKVAVGVTSYFKDGYKPEWQFTDWRLSRDDKPQNYIDDNEFTCWQKIKRPKTKIFTFEGVTHGYRVDDAICGFNPSPLSSPKNPVYFGGDALINCEDCKAIILDRY
jgi:hypothetical protein